LEEITETSGLDPPRSRAHREWRNAVDTEESSAPYAHPSNEDDDDTLEAHYACLERLRPCACIDGWVFVGYIDEHGEEREASYACRRCAPSPR
jgi:hypothetical protein